MIYKLSELIIELVKVLEKTGDIEVYINNTEYNKEENITQEMEQYIDRIKIVEAKYGYNGHHKHVKIV